MNTTKTDMTNGRRTIDIDITQQKNHHPQLKSESHARAMSISFPPVRSQRRLHKWNDKTDELTTVAEDDDNEMNDDDNDENGPLVQSLSAMASHLMNNKGSDGEDPNNSSPEKDVYITEKGHSMTTPLDDQDTESDTEETASEEDSTDQADISTNNERKHGGDMNDMGGEEEDEEENGDSDKMSAKLKSDHYSTTPKGLTTWSDVNGPSQMPMYQVSKVTAQKMPVEYTISSVLSFSTERPHTTPEMVVIKERVTSTEPTTRMTSKVNLMPPSSSAHSIKNKRKPFNKNKKVPPSRFVKPQLEEVTAEVTSVGETHVVYKTKVTSERPEMKTSGVTDYYDRFTTKKPLWPYQMTTRRVATKRPAPFSRVTTRPKNPYAKRPQSALSMTTPTTTTPASTTTYLRNPQTSIMSPLSGLTLSLTDIPFMDFVRSQIIPRIGLTLISFMASTPLLLSLLGAAGLRRRKRSVDFSSFNGKALFESQKRGFHQNHNLDDREHFDFSTIQKKLEDAMKQPLRRKIGSGNNSSNGVAPHSSSFDLIAEAFRHLARWWATKSAPLKTRTLNNGDEAPLADSSKTSNLTSADTELTEYPVFISVTEDTQQQTAAPESEVVTESYMFIEEQEVDDDDNDDESDSSTVSSAIVKTTLPMQPPKSSPEQEEVLRELKKLWDYSEKLSDTQDNGALKTSLSSIVHLAYARIYSEPDETLLKLKLLLQKLQAKLLGTETNADESLSTTERHTDDAMLAQSSSSPFLPLISSSFTSTFTPTTVTAELISSTTAASPPANMLMDGATVSSNETGRRRRKRSYYDGYEDIESIFFANNVNSEENSLIPDDKLHYNLQQSKNQSNVSHNDSKSFVDSSVSSNLNDTTVDPLDRSLLSIGAVSSSTMVSISSTPATMVQKVIHINDRLKPASASSFYLSLERIQELKSRITSTTSTPSTTVKTSTLPPISIIIDDELENEVNSLQQQQHVDNYDVHISDAIVPLTTSPSPPSFIKKKTSTTTTTEIPYTAEEIAFALFQLLQPVTTDEDDYENSTSPGPTPSDILYQVDSLSSALNTNTTKSKNVTVTSSTSTINDDSNGAAHHKNNATLLIPPSALSNLGYTTSTTERQIAFYNMTHVLQQPELDETGLALDASSMSPTNIINGTKESISQMVQALTGLSSGAKMVLLFATSISILSIGLGIYSFGPPLIGIGVLGIIIPIGLLLLFETTSSGKRKLTTRQQQKLINKLHSEEFSKIVDLIFDAMLKYNKG
ncbi:unnamed protein product [Orchesella dallaii]|uniref:Uncharacterized protein n=1 Tax=Orchesella dallaii TaxID=48710 RepID=A0ABP1QY10_9HEXA